MNDEQTTASFWDNEAGGYDAEHDSETPARNPLWIRMAAVSSLLGASPGIVLDCGMGPGRLLLELARRGWTVAGIDVSAEMVALARARLPEKTDQLLQGSVESLPFPAASFDAAVATGVLEYVEDVPRALAEVARVLRPGGLFVVGAPNTRAVRTLLRLRVVYPAVRVLKAHLRFGRPLPLARPGVLSRPRLEFLLRDAGLEVEHVQYIVVTTIPLRAHFPSVSARVAGYLGGSELGSFFGAQLVVAARKPVGGIPGKL